MCGIVGIYRKKGLRVADIEKFTEMLKRCQIRGTHATGVFNSRFHYLKSPVKAEEFIETGEYAVFKKHSIGCKYIIGHCRLSTRGKPEITRNDHPVFDEKKRFFLVHNGILSCTKFDKTPEEVDTSIFVHVIGEKIDASRSNIDTLDIIVDRAFCIIEKESTSNSSVIVVGNHDEIVFCKNKDRPLLWQSQDDDIIVFGSETTIIEEKDNGKPFDVLQDYMIQYIDLRTGNIDGRDLKCEKKSYSRKEKTVMHGKDHEHEAKAVTTYMYGGTTYGGHWCRSGRIVNGKWEYDWDDQYPGYNWNTGRGSIPAVPAKTTTIITTTPEPRRVVEVTTVKQDETVAKSQHPNEKTENVGSIYEEICTDCVYADINYVDDGKAAEKGIAGLDDVTRCEMRSKVVNIKKATNCDDFKSKF